MTERVLGESAALVSGATSGLGRALAVGLAEQGMRVVAIGRNPAALAELESIPGGRIRAVRTDLMNAADIARAVEVATSEVGPIDVLVLGAGVSIVGPLDALPAEALSEALGVNFIAPMEIVRQVLPGMLRRGHGIVIGIVSGADARGLPGASAYSAPKAGLRNALEGIRNETRGTGVRVITVSPGPMETELYSRQQVFGMDTDMFSPSGGARPEDVAERVLSAFNSGKDSLEFSWRGRIARSGAVIAPALLDRLLTRQFRRPRPLRRPTNAVDIHAYIDGGRATVDTLLSLAQSNGIAHTVISPACTLVSEPSKAEAMYILQRHLLKHGPTRAAAGRISQTFYNANGELRGGWRLFTRDGAALNKVMYPDNKGLHAELSGHGDRASMWWWINPDSGSLTEARDALDDNRVAGLKFHAYWHGFDLRLLTPYLKECSDAGKPAYVILGFGPSGRYQWLLEEHPDTTIILGYGGFPHFKPVWRSVAASSRALIDVTSNHLDQTLIAEAIRTVGLERVVYGSDAPYNFPGADGHFSYDKTFRRLDLDWLSDDQLDAIYRRNARLINVG